MSLTNMPLNERVAIWQTNGKIIGGYVLERTREFVRLRDVFEIEEEAVIGTSTPVYLPRLSYGGAPFEIPFTSILRWTTLQSILPTG